METEARLAKNAQIKAAGAATRAKRASQQAVTRELKLVDSSLSAAQREALTRAFLEAKWLYNQLVSGDHRTWDSKSKTAAVRLPDGSFEERQLRFLGSQVKQSLVKQIDSSIKTLATLKRRGKKVGALRPVRRVTALQFVQSGVTWSLRKNKVKLQGLPGLYRVRGLHQLEGLELASARLVQRPSGYYLKVTGFRAPVEPGSLPAVGLDVGIKTHLTASDGREWSTLVREPERLKRLQRKLQRQAKGSKNRAKTLSALGIEYEKLTRRKDATASQVVSELKAHSRIVLQDEALSQWKLRYGKTIQHSILGRVKAKLSALPQTVVLDRWVPTTQWCPTCGAKNRLALSQRLYSCACGYAAPRDLHAARNMLLLAQLSPEGLGAAPVERRASAGSLASGKSPSAKQETMNDGTRVGERGALAETVSSSVAP